MAKSIQFKDNDEKVYPNPYYPVGSIYLSFSSENPSKWFGGTWERITGKFLFGAIDNDVNYSAGKTGGEEKHMLIEDEMPRHAHKLFDGAGGPDVFTPWVAKDYSNIGSQSVNGYASITEYTGKFQPHNNMPPFLAIYMWKRIA